MSQEQSILWFKDIKLEDINIVGGKNASLGEMYCNLDSEGILIPNGFSITTYTYDQFLKFNGLEEKVETILNQIDYED